MSQKPTPTTQTTTAELSPEQRQILQLGLPGVQQFAATVPQRYQGSTVAGFDPTQVAGQEAALGAVPAQAGLAANAANATNFFTGGSIWDPGANAALAGAVGAATRPITQNYNEVVRPTIRTAEQNAGQFGSSKAGIVDAAANRDYLNAIGDTSSKLVQSQYQTNVDAQLKALGLTPTVQGAQLAPATTTSAVGDVRQQLEQAIINERLGNFNYDQLAPFLQSKEILSLLSGIPGGSTTTVGSTAKPNTALSALGGAASGAALGSALFPGVGTGAGAGIGALLPFLLK